MPNHSIISKISQDLKSEDGIYFSKQTASISYPSEGNMNCYQIEKDSFWFNHRNNCIIECVKKYSGDQVFLDIGGGNGFVAKGLQDSNVESVLIEPGIKGCRNAKKRGLHNIICSTLEGASINPNSIASAGAFDVVEHIEDDIAFLDQIHQLLKDDGYLYLTVPAYQLLWSNEDVDAGHYRRYKLSELEKKLKSVGFKISYSTYFFSFLPLPIFLFRSVPSKLGFNKKSKDLTKHQKEHQQKNGWLSKLINMLMKMEVEHIKKSKGIPFGGSCLIVAMK